LSFFTPAAVRAMELADWYRAQGYTVVAGGIFPTMMPDVVQPHVDAVIMGEGESVWPQVLRDHVAGKLKNRYGPIICDLETLPPPRTDLYFSAEGPTFHPDDYPLQVSRGCPMQCIACALPGTMGKKLRAFPLDHIKGQLDLLEAHHKRANLTEDTGWFTTTSAGRRMGQLFDLVAQRGKSMSISYVGISMPMILAAGDRWLRRAKSAGVDLFYLVGGFDPITTRAFTGQDPKALDRAFRAVAKAQEHGIEPYTSFLLGNDGDDIGTVDRMLEFSEKAGIRKAEFAIFTPYPNTPVWHRLIAEDRILTRNWTHYNDANVVFKPAQMSPDDLHEGYLRLWREFYAARPEVMEMSEMERTIQF
ncbi:MAG: radical SAM protein, partial [Oligoflexia bacterium]|nr:radical SAM protein [Oligoflexia bacterium]